MSARRLIGAGLLLACCALALMIIAPAEALRGWLGALFLWSGVPIGALGFIMSIRIIGGRWGHRLLPFFEAGALTLPIIALGMLPIRSEEHTSELQSLMRISYAVFCLNKKKKN